MCSGHACGVHWIDLEDQRRAGGMLLGCLGVLGGLLEVPWGPLGVSWEVLGCLGGPGSVLGTPCGGPWGDFGGLGRSLDQSWEVRILLFRLCLVVFWDVMFFDDFSEKFRGDDVFWKNENLYGFYIDSRRFTCCYFMCFRYVF